MGDGETANRVLAAGWVTDPKGTLERCARAIRKARGVIVDAAKALGIGRSTLWRYIQQHDELAAVLEEMRRAHHGSKPMWGAARKKNDAVTKRA